MGYVIDEADFDDGLPDGDVDAEARSESFVLVAEEGNERIELLYTDIPRLKKLLTFLEGYNARRNG